MLNRELGNVPGNGIYQDDAVGWALDGKLPFAYMNFHDDEVRAIWWDGNDLIFEQDPESCYRAGEVRIAFIDARVTHENGWFAAPRIWWQHDVLRLVDDGYEVDITGLYLAADEESQPPIDRAVDITLRARDIRVIIDGEVKKPTPGRLPDYLLVQALHENAPAERRAEARRRILAQSDFEHRMLVHPFPWKSCWAGCADILCELGDEVLEPLLPDLLEWIIDLDWPGARTIFDRLSRMPPARLQPALEKAIERAKAEGDKVWRKNLRRLT